VPGEAGNGHKKAQKIQKKSETFCEFCAFFVAIFFGGLDRDIAPPKTLPPAPKAGVKNSCIYYLTPKYLKAYNVISRILKNQAEEGS